MEQLIEILEEIRPGVDYETSDSLIDSHILTSLDVISIVAELEDAFDIVIPTTQITAQNFNSASALYALVESLQEE